MASAPTPRQSRELTRRPATTINRPSVSIKRLLAGIAICVAAAPLLWANEGLAAQAAEVSIDPTAETLDPAPGLPPAAQLMVVWLFRAIGFALNFFGLFLMADPIRSASRRFAALRDLFDLGVRWFAIVVSLVITVATITIAWLYHRPMLGLIVASVTVVALAVTAIAIFGKLGHRLSASKAEESTAAR